MPSTLTDKEMQTMQFEGSGERAYLHDYKDYGSYDKWWDSLDVNQRVQAGMTGAASKAREAYGVSSSQARKAVEPGATMNGKTLGQTAGMSPDQYAKATGRAPVAKPPSEIAVPVVGGPGQVGTLTKDEYDSMRFTPATRPATGGTGYGQPVSGIGGQGPVPGGSTGYLGQTPGWPGPNAAGGVLGAQDIYGQPVLRNIDPRLDTVQGQLAQIQQGDSVLMELARQEGLRQAAARGLGNTSLAAQAAQAALLERATPIAQQDASTYLKQGLTNQEVQNQMIGRMQEGAINKALAQEKGRIDLNLMSKEFELKAQEIAQTAALTRQQENAKQAAALQAQYIQAVAEINKADMNYEGKQEQIKALRNDMLQALAGTAKAFGTNPEEYLTYIEGTIDAVDAQFGQNVQDQLTNAQEIKYALSDGVDQDGRFYYEARGKRYYEGDKAPAGYSWSYNNNGMLQLAPWAPDPNNGGGGGGSE